MKYRNVIFGFFLSLSSLVFSQSYSTNIDTLLFKVFETVDLKDSSKYIAVVNSKALFVDKKMYTKQDSLLKLQPFYRSYSDFIESIAEMSGSDKFSLKYLEFDNPSKKMINSDFTGKVLLHVKLLVNDSFVITCPFNLTCQKGIYTSENNLMTQFLEN